jgi:hypothetical protein
MINCLQLEQQCKKTLIKANISASRLNVVAGEDSSVEKIQMQLEN